MRAWALSAASGSLIGMSASAATAQETADVNLAPLLIWAVFYIAFIVGVIWVLLIPTIIAFRRKHPHRWLILIISVLFSATGIGWIVALIWALNSLPFKDDFHGRLGTVRVAADAPLPVVLPHSPPVRSDDPADQLQRLKQLHASGALTDEEYQRARRPLLDRLLS